MSVISKTLNHRYRIEKLIARGGMASVYLAHDERLEREVAVKIIHAHLSDDPTFKAKFLREAKMVAKLSHPNIVNIFDQGQDGDLTYLVMEYVPSITLREALTRFGSIPAKRSLQLFEAILEGLSAAHQIGMLHRDIKPENIFLSDDGRIKLGDFGLARDIDSHTSTGALVGTIAYLSPELITRGQADAPSDVYAAGIVLFEMLTGRQPFQGEEAAHIAHQHTTAQMPEPSSIQKSVPPIVDELVLWSTARAAHHRPADASELLAVTKKVSAELKAGRGGTAKLDLPEIAKTRLLEPADLESDETQVISEIPRTQVFESDSIGSTDSTQQLQHFALDSTQRFDDFTEQQDQLSPLQQFVRRRKIRAKVFWILIPLLTVLASMAGWALSTGPAVFSGIPDVSNLTVEQAKAELEPFAPNFSETKQNSANIAAGRIISTEPAAGAWFFRGSNLKLIVSKGPVMVVVPNLLGKTTSEAEADLAAVKLKLGQVFESYNPDIVSGNIYDFQGKDQKKIAEGSSVDVEVSLGALPSVINISKSEALKLLKIAKLTVLETKSEYNDEVAKGQALRIEPVQNPLRKGGEVVLVVSKGPTTVTMPDVVGETLNAAKKLLKTLGLEVQIDTDQLTSMWGIAKVKSQSAEAGSSVNIGTTVTISSK